MKLLSEKAVTSVNETIYILVLNVSKAFDTVNRKVLLQDLDDILDNDKLHMLKVILGVQPSIRRGVHESELLR